MPELVAPTERLRIPWLEAHAEWGPGLHEDGFGLGPSDELESPEGFAAWLAAMAARSDPSTTEVGGHRCAYWWIVEGGHVVGGAALRQSEDDYVAWAGHVGFGIRPSARRRGLARWALGRVLVEARAFGLPRVLAVCAVDNTASARTIERCGGVFEGVRDTSHGPVRRYWLTVPTDG